MDVYISFLQDPGPRPFVASTLDPPLGALDPFYQPTSSESSSTGQNQSTKSIREAANKCLNQLAKMRVGLRTHITNRCNFFNCACTNINENSETSEPPIDIDDYPNLIFDYPSGTILIDSPADFDKPPCYETAINMPQPSAQHRQLLLCKQHQYNLNLLKTEIDGNNCVNTRFHFGRRERQKLTAVVVNDVTVRDNDSCCLPSYQAAQAMHRKTLERTRTARTTMEVFEEHPHTCSQSWFCFCGCPTMYQSLQMP